MTDETGTAQAPPSEGRGSVYVLELHRTRLGAKATLGDLYVEGVFFCHTLEDVVRDLGPDGAGKVFGETAIPAGTYPVVVDFSNRFQRPMPHVLDVPFFDGIRIHKGNSDANTEGCLLLGQVIAGDDWIAHSTEAFDAFFPALQTALAAGRKAEIVISDDFKVSA